MKKFITAMLVSTVLMITSAYAQPGRATLMPLVEGDTAVNTTAVNKVITLTAGYEGVVIQPVLTKVSGTVAGTVVLYESLDGTNYKSTGDTLTLANSTTNTVVWKKVSPVPVFYKATTVGSGTMSAIVRIYYVPRKHD